MEPRYPLTSRLSASSWCLGSLSIGTPGELLGYAEAYRRFGGGVSWASLFEETIRLCEEGFEVTHPLAFAIEKHREEILRDRQLR